MSRRRVLLGLVFEESFAAGAVSFLQGYVESIRPHVDLSLISVTSTYSLCTDGPLVERRCWNGVPCLHVRPKTWLEYDLTESAPSTAPVEEGRQISREIAAWARDTGSELLHVMEWEPLRGALFQAGFDAGLPVVVTPFDYRLACPQVYLRERNRGFCTGPDRSGRKCRVCLDEVYRIPSSWKRRLMTSTPLGSLLGPLYEPQWSLVQRRRAMARYARGVRLLCAFSPTWADVLNEHLGLPESQIRVVDYGLLTSPPRIPVGRRYERPLRFGYLQRVSLESGAMFLLDAWADAAISPNDAVLRIYADQGGRDLLRASRYAALLESGSLQVEEGRIGDRLDEVLTDLSAVVVAYQLRMGISSVGYEAVARGIPVIAPRWEHRGQPCEEGIVEGLNALKYVNYDAASLTQTLQRAAADPSALRTLAEGCALPDYYGRDAYMKRYLQVYDSVCSR